MLCVKCGHQAALLSGSHSDAAMETINKLTRLTVREEICNNCLSLSRAGGSFQNIKSHFLAFHNNSHSLIFY